MQNRSLDLTQVEKLTMGYHVTMRAEQPIIIHVYQFRQVVRSDGPITICLNKEIVDLGLSLGLTIRQKKQEAQASRPEFHGFQHCCTSVLPSIYAQA